MLAVACASLLPEGDEVFPAYSHWRFMRDDDKRAVSGGYLDRQAPEIRLDSSGRSLRILNVIDSV